MPSVFQKVFSRDNIIRLVWIVVIGGILGFFFYKYILPNLERFEPTLVNFSRN